MWVSYRSQEYWMGHKCDLSTGNFSPVQNPEFTKRVEFQLITMTPPLPSFFTYDNLNENTMAISSVYLQYIAHLFLSCSRLFWQHSVGKASDIRILILQWLHREDTMVKKIAGRKAGGNC